MTNKYAFKSSKQILLSELWVERKREDLTRTLSKSQSDWIARPHIHEITMK